MRASRVLIITSLTTATDVNVVLSGQVITVGQGTLTVNNGSGWSVVDIDLDDSVYDGQTGVVIHLSGTVAASGKKVFIGQGVNKVEQTVTAEDSSTVTITVSYGGVLSSGAATLYVRNPL